MVRRVVPRFLPMKLHEYFMIVWLVLRIEGLSSKFFQTTCMIISRLVLGGLMIPYEQGNIIHCIMFTEYCNHVFISHPHVLWNFSWIITMFVTEADYPLGILMRDNFPRSAGVQINWWTRLFSLVTSLRWMMLLSKEFTDQWWTKPSLLVYWKTATCGTTMVKRYYFCWDHRMIDFYKTTYHFSKDAIK